MTFSVEYISALDTGRARRNNEDAVLIDQNLSLCVLADGMGGYNAGEVASDMAVHGMRDEMARLLGSRGPADESGVARAMMMASRATNSAVFDASRSNPEFAGMGTTLVMALFGGSKIWVGHIGDSRAYRLREGRLERISKDHSLLQEQLDAGLITPEEAAVSLQRNLVTRAMGVEPEVELEVHGHEWHSGDVVLLCSDGLSDMLPDSAIAQIMNANSADLQAMANALVAGANAAGGRDNISVILGRITGENTPTGRAWWPFRR